MVGDRNKAIPMFVPKMPRAIRMKLSRTNGTTMKKIAAIGAPNMSHGLRRPNRLIVRSERAPT